jgi:putative oxygen-independent coproporphyrinogen III oxidase
MIIPTKTLSLYIHAPWCVKKCPYCDFNSHALLGDLPEKKYFEQLHRDLERHDSLLKTRTLTTIFVGGGTPSLFSAQSYHALLEHIKKTYSCSPDLEVTLEANPGTVEQERFARYCQAGINRLSIGIQSFNPDALKRLGRIHDGDMARRAIDISKMAGFENFNLDLMHGLPHQSIQESLDDLNTALSYHPTHLSWYHLTLEPNTLFYQKPPPLPDSDHIAEEESLGFALLHEKGYEHYEISAFSKPHRACQHNLNYWRFGDYLGIGAGAHSKITLSNGKIERFVKLKHPKQYLAADNFLIESQIIESNALVFEYLLNVLRLYEKHFFNDFEKATGLPGLTLQKALERPKERGFITIKKDHFILTDLGERFLNDVLALFV